MTDVTEARYQACKALLKAGDVAAARREMAQAILDAPADPKLQWLSAHICAREGRSREAVAAFQLAIDLDPKNAAYWEDFSKCLKQAAFFAPSDALTAKLLEAIARDDIDNSGALLAAQATLTHHFKALAAGGAPLSCSSLAVLDEAADTGPVRRLLLAFLAYGRTRTPILEKFLTELRRSLLAEAVLQPAQSAAPDDVAAALAVHCFNNEYVFAESTEETETLAGLRQDIASRLAGGAPVSRFGVAVYAAYRPLTREAWVDDIPPVAEDAPEFSLLLLTQIAAPRRERELAQYIPRVTPITDHVSQGVRQQYEENPYPRWERLMVGRGTSKSVPVGAPEKRILVAGCGTGRHPLLTALAAPQCEVWAMDLSRPSLAYGMRRAQDYGIGNVRFVQGDILELGALTEVFDEISCGGVLHHLRDPAQGLAALRGRLADNGTLRLAIYTESGRQAVVAGIALRQDRGFAATPADIRRFRDIVFQLSKDHPAADLRASADFYTMSDCRDLVFHVQEHRFTLPRLEAMYTDAGFKLARFHPKPGNAAWFESTYPGRDPYTDLRTWAKVEAQRPGLFGSMYNIDLVKA